MLPPVKPATNLVCSHSNHNLQSDTLIISGHFCGSHFFFFFFSSCMGEDCTIDFWLHDEYVSIRTASVVFLVISGVKCIYVLTTIED